MLPGSMRRAGTTGELTPLTLAEAGRVGTTDPESLDGCRETETASSRSSWSRASRAAALAAVLAVGAIAALASGGIGGGVALASAPLGAGRNRVHQVEETREAQTSGLAPEVERPRLGEPEAEAEEAAVTAEGETLAANEDAGDALVEEVVEETVEEAVPEEAVEEAFPEEAAPEEAVEEAFPEEAVPEETFEETVPEETIPEETVPEETVPEETVPEEAVEEDASEETVSPTEEARESPTDSPSSSTSLSTPSSAALGSFSSAATRYCAEAFTAPTRFGSLSESRVSVTMNGILKYADRIYLLCTDMCDSLVVPSELAEKVTLVDGYAIDACGGYGDDVRHWEKASLAHKAAMQDAFDADPDVNVLAILEQDTEGDGDVNWSNDDWVRLGEALERQDWNTLRLSYRPYDFEKGRDARLGEPGVACPAECACDALADKLCMMRSSGCAMQSSDAYFVHRRAVAAMVPQLGARRVIDYHVFKDTPNQLFVAPAVARQTSYSYGPDYITVEDGKESVRVFLEKCRREQGKR